MPATPRPRRSNGMTTRLANTPLAVLLAQFKDRSDLHRLLDELQTVIMRVTTRRVPRGTRFAIRGTQTKPLTLPYEWKASVEGGDGTLHELTCSITLWYSPVSRTVDARGYRFSFLIQLLEASPVPVHTLTRDGYCGQDGLLLAYDSVKDREIAADALTLYDFPGLPWLDRLWDDVCPLLPSPIELELALQHLTPSQAQALRAAAPAASAEAPGHAPRDARDSAEPDEGRMRVTSEGLADLIAKRDAAQQAITQTQQAAIAAYRLYLTDTQDVTLFMTSQPEAQFTDALAWAQQSGTAAAFAYPREQWQRDKPRIAEELDRLVAVATQRLATYEQNLTELRVHTLVLQRVCEQMGHAEVDRVADAPQEVVCRRCGGRFTPAVETAPPTIEVGEDEEDDARTIQVRTPPNAPSAQSAQSAQPGQTGRPRSHTRDWAC